jgi:hypothetical protein
MAHYRNTIAIKAERAEDLEREIAETRARLALLEEEATRLRAQWQEATEWAAVPTTTARFLRGAGLGLGFVCLLPMLAMTVLASWGLPLSALVLLFKRGG